MFWNGKQLKNILLFILQGYQLNFGRHFLKILKFLFQNQSFFSFFRHTIQDILICLSKNVFFFFFSKLCFCLGGGPQNVADWSATTRCFFPKRLQGNKTDFQATLSNQRKKLCYLFRVGPHFVIQSTFTQRKDNTFKQVSVLS